MPKKPLIIVSVLLFYLFINHSYGQSLQLNELEYFEKPGLNVLVFSNQYNGMFFDEKTAGIEIIHHGVRTQFAEHTTFDDRGRLRLILSILMATDRARQYKNYFGCGKPYTQMVRQRAC